MLNYVDEIILLCLVILWSWAMPVTREGFILLLVELFLRREADFVFHQDIFLESEIPSS